MHVLIAPNAFKNAVTADKAAKYIFEGLSKSKLKFTATIFPAGDGGDGTGALLIQKTSASIINAVVKNVSGRKINASFGFTNDKTAIIELADVCGLRLMKADELDPLHFLTTGVGELIKIALDKKAKRILLCIGGSCTIDGGVGILQALGIKFFDAQGNGLNNLPENLINVEKIDSSNLDQRIKNPELIILCDVENYLLGRNGAARVFGPQKGASKNDIEKIERSLKKIRDITLAYVKKDMALIKHGGAAGGVAASLAAFLNARLVSGIDYFLDYTNFDEALEKADLVITGEGKIDDQTLQGKAPFGVAFRAWKKNISVIGLAGKIEVSSKSELHKYFSQLISINNKNTDLATALKNTPENLIIAAKKIGNELALKN